MINTLDKYLRKIFAEEFLLEFTEKDAVYEEKFAKWKSNLTIDQISKFADDFDLIS